MGKIVIAVLLAVIPMTPASAQEVAHFLARVDRLLARPVRAVVARFLSAKRLVEADGEQLKHEYEVEKSLGHRTAFCPPAYDKPRVGKNEYLAALRAVPLARRSTADTKDVLRTVLERKYPCR